MATIILFRVFLGGREGNQVAHFTTAMGLIRNQLKDYDIRFETKDVDEIKKLEWSPKELINWLLGIEVNNKTIFIILGHLHQVNCDYISYGIGKNLLFTHFTGT